MRKKIDKLHEAYLIYTDSPQTSIDGSCQKVDGRGWADEKRSAFSKAELYVKNAEGVPAINE